MFSNTFGHTPARKAFKEADVYAIGYDEERSQRQSIRLGFIGSGGVVQSKHLPALWRLRTLWEPVMVAALAEPDLRTGQKVAQLYNCRHYEDFNCMLDEEALDAVVVATPDDLHYECTLASLERGLHVMVEKPIARSLLHAREMCKLADEKELKLMTVANKRYSPPYRYARKFIEDGPVSDPALYVARFNLGYDYVWLLEQGTIHIFDMTCHLMGGVRTVYAQGVNKYERNRAGYWVDNIAMTLSFVSGAVGNIYTSATALSFKPWERVEVYGNKAWLTVDDQYELYLYDDEVGPAKHWKPAFPNTLMFDEEFAGFLGMYENFLQAIRGTEKIIATGWDGYNAYELNVAAHLSMRRQAAVALPLDPAAADDELNNWLEQR